MLSASITLALTNLQLPMDFPTEAKNDFKAVIDNAIDPKNQRNYRPPFHL